MFIKVGLIYIKRDIRLMKTQWVSKRKEVPNTRERME